MKSNNAGAIFSSPDDLKLRSSMTLFDAVPSTLPVFSQMPEKFYGVSETSARCKCSSDESRVEFDN